MNGLSLCAGGGSLDLGIEIAFPAYRCIAAVENNPEAVKRFRLRYPQAKVFRDVLGFDGRPLHGLVDCIVAGWPCQPHSVAGKRLGTADERWIWSDIARIIGETGAPLFFGENVSGLLRDATGNSPEDGDGGDVDDDADGSMGGMGTVLRDLAEMGFVSFWGSLRAAQVGAAHGRPRVFVLAYKPGGRFRTDRSAQRESGYVDERSGGLEHAAGARFDRQEVSVRDDGRQLRRRPSVYNCRPDGTVADASNGQLPEPGRGPERRDGAGSGGAILENGTVGLADASKPGLPGSELSELPGADGEHERGTITELRGAPLEDSSRPPVQTGRGGPGRWRGVREAGVLQEHGSDFGIFAPGPNDPLWIDILAASPHLAPALSPVTAGLALALSEGTFDLQAEIESGFRGLADGVARWLVERRPRLQIGGNGVVPLQAAAVFTELARRARLR